MKIYIVRHGETDANKQGKLQGLSDEPLNINGINLAKITGKALKDINFYKAYSSPLLRAKTTISTILNENNNPSTPIILDNRLIEVDMGDWQGKRFKEPNAEINISDANQFFTNPFEFSGIPNGESVYLVCNRTQQFVKELISLNNDNNYLIGTHGFAMRAMLNFLYKDKHDFWHGHVPYNCSLSVIEAKNGDIKLIQDDIIFYNK